MPLEEAFRQPLDLLCLMTDCVLLMWNCQGNWLCDTMKPQLIQWTLFIRKQIRGRQGSVALAWGRCLSKNLLRGRVAVVRDCPFTPRCTGTSLTLRRWQMRACVSDDKQIWSHSDATRDIASPSYYIKRDRVRYQWSCAYTVYKELNPSCGLIFFLCFRRNSTDSLPLHVSYSIFWHWPWLFLTARCSKPTPMKIMTGGMKRWTRWHPRRSMSWRNGWRSWNFSL